MSVTTIMDPQTPVSTETGDCISLIYRQMIDAASVETISQVDTSLDWLGGIQSQISWMVHGLSVKESIHREVGAEGMDFNEQDYETLITFLSGLGLAMSEVSERLRAAKAQIETDQLNQRRRRS